METNENYNKDKKEAPEFNTYENRGGKFLAGMIVVTVGSVLLLREMGMYIPYWLTSWPMLPIVIGLFVGARHGFRGYGWLIPVIIGVVFLSDEIFPDLVDRHYVWPMALIIIGMFIMVSPSRRWGHRSRRWRRDRWDRWADSAVKADLHAQGVTGSTEDFIDSTSIFGGVEKNVVTKDFKGGDVTTFFGGAQLNFMQADIKDTAVLDLTQVFGGTKLIIPADWKVKSDLVSVFGGIEDKRSVRKDDLDSPGKRLILRGTSIFGGIEINSY